MATSIRKFGSVHAEHITTSSFSVDKSSVTQITSDATAVTITEGSGVITLVTSVLAAGASSTFTVNNPSSTVNSVVMGSIAGYSGTTGVPIVRLGNISNGTFTVTLTNAHGTLALNGIVKVSVLVI